MSHQQIIDDIQAQTEKELNDIQRQYDTVRAQKLDSLERKIADIAAEADQKIEQEKIRIQARTSRTLAQEERRANLALQERVIQKVTESVRGKLGYVQQGAEYTRTLLSWITEAAIGLGYGSESSGVSPGPVKALIRCSPEDKKIFQRNIADFQKEITAVTGIVLELGMDSILLSSGTAGLVLIDSGGRMAFSNTLADRFRRVSPDIQRLVMERFFPGEMNE